MKYFVLGTVFAVVLAAGSALLVSSFTLEPVSAEVVRDCTLSQVKECWNGQTNPCCPPKVMEQVARNCTWSEVKDCYSGNPNPNNTCCPPKMQMQMSVATPSDADVATGDQLARKCTWGEIKACYSGGPIPPNPCCPPKQMDNPIG